MWLWSIYKNIFPRYLELHGCTIFPDANGGGQYNRRYARCWWHINVEKNVWRLLFHFFFFLICVCITWVWLGWRWGGCVLMYCSSFRNFSFCFYWFLFYFRLLVYICVVGVFLYGVCFNVCLLICFVVLFRFYSLFIFIYCLCNVTVLYQFFFESICCSKMRLSYYVCLLIDCIRCIFENLS